MGQISSIGGKELKGRLEFIIPELKTRLQLPYSSWGIRAGFPSPAEESITERIDLNKELVRHPASTFLARVVGLSMVEEGIDEGDVIVIDRSLEPRDGDLAVCAIDGEFTLKRLNLKHGRVLLMPSNHNFKPIEVTKDNEFVIWGIVAHTIKYNRRR